MKNRAILFGLVGAGIVLLAVGLWAFPRRRGHVSDRSVDQEGTAGNEGRGNVRRSPEAGLLPFFAAVPWRWFRIRIDGGSHMIALRRYPSGVSQEQLLSAVPPQGNNAPGASVAATNVSYCRQVASIRTVDDLKGLTGYGYFAEAEKEDRSKYVKRAGGWEKMLEIATRAAKQRMQREYVGEAICGDYRILLFRESGSSVRQEVYRSRDDGLYYLMNRWPKDLSQMIGGRKLANLLESVDAGGGGS